MHLKLIIKLMSIMAFILSIFMLPSLILSIIIDKSETVFAFTISLLLMLVPAFIGIMFTKNYKSSSVSTKDGFFLVTIAWITISVYSALPYYLSEVLPTWADCFFESVSGITTTGATVIGDVESCPKGIILWRSMTHWLGGVGIVVLTVALLPILGIGGLQLMKAEASGLDNTDSRKMTSSIAQTAKMLWSIYIVLTLISFIFLKIAGMNAFDALNHAMSAIASGGFSTKNNSIAYYDSAFIDWILVCSMLLAGINFSIFFMVISGKFKDILKNTEFKLYMLIIFLVGTIITFINYYNMPGQYSSIFDSARYSFFQVVSMMTTTGMVTQDYLYWPYICQFLIFIILTIGGCAGSTAGGFKVIRFAILMKQARNEIKHTLHPRGVFIIRLNGVSINKEVVYSVFAFLFLFLTTVVGVTLILTTCTDILTAISAGFSIVANSGPGFGQVGPVLNYSFFPGYAKVVLSFAMLIGRLEIYTFFALLTPYFWKRM